jgi:hypothetical protein
MRLGYNYLRKKIAPYSKRLMMTVSLFALPVSPQMERVASAEPVVSRPSTLTIKPADSVIPEADPRTVRLIRFFSRLHCPVLTLAEDFVHEADVNQLDWRLLPSISVIESGGGKAYKNNNIFGWDKGLQLFPSIQSGIREVAYKLGRSPLYKNRDSVAKLRVYNPDAGYAKSVVTVMNRISPVVNVQPLRRTMAQARSPQAYAFE